MLMLTGWPSSGLTVVWVTVDRGDLPSVTEHELLLSGHGSISAMAGSMTAKRDGAGEVRSRCSDPVDIENGRPLTLTDWVLGIQAMFAH